MESTKISPSWKRDWSRELKIPILLHGRDVAKTIRSSLRVGRDRVILAQKAEKSLKTVMFHSPNQGFHERSRSFPPSADEVPGFGGVPRPAGQRRQTRVDQWIQRIRRICGCHARGGRTLVRRKVKQMSCHKIHITLYDVRLFLNSAGIMLKRKINWIATGLSWKATKEGIWDGANTWIRSCK